MRYSRLVIELKTVKLATKTMQPVLHYWCKASSIAILRDPRKTCLATNQARVARGMVSANQR